MSVIVEEKENSKVLPDTEDLEYKIEIATQILDRNIGFLTNEGVNEIFNIVKTCIEAKSFCHIFYLVCFTGAIFLLVWGMFNLGSVLVAKTSEEALGRKDESSRIFFAGIIKNGNYVDYKQKFYAMNREDFLNDLIEQIYINANIASIKYATYNRGLRCTIVGFIFFIVLLLIGIYVY